MSAATQQARRRAKGALFWSSILHEPFSALYLFIPFILYKDLHASAFAIALLVMLKPVVTILSFYWSAGSRGRLRANVVGAGILMRAPFFLCPWIDVTWYLIAAAVNYMLFYRAGAPAWMEILRKAGERGKAFALSSAVGYGEGVLLSLGFGSLLDHDPGLWKMLFVAGALIGLIGTIVQARVPIVEDPKEPRPLLKELLVRPWRDSWELIRTRRDFATFQWGFMVCGFAIMLIQPVLTPFEVDDLGISHIQMALAISVAKGLGYVVSAPLWGHWMERRPIHQLASWVFLMMALYPILLALAKWQLVWFFIAFLWYGVGQGGSHLIWNMSGPHFAGKEESARYTGVNVVMAGLRGAVGPHLGGVIGAAWGALPVFGIGAILCLWSGLHLLKPFKKKSLAAN